MGNNLKVDGVIGPITLAAINAASPDRLFEAINQQRWNRIRNWAARTHGQERFCKKSSGRVPSVPEPVEGIEGGFDKLSHREDRKERKQVLSLSLP